MGRIRVASLNVENLFERPKAMSGPMTPAGNPVLDAHARLNTVLRAETYTPALKDEILTHLGPLGLLRSDQAEFAVLRQVRGKLVKRPKAPSPPEIIAGGREDWIGWVDLVKVRVDELAMTHTARVIGDVDADIIAVIEARAGPRSSTSPTPACSTPAANRSTHASWSSTATTTAGSTSAS